jgi:hypothetical protein
MFRLLEQRLRETEIEVPTAHANADHPRTVWRPANIETITAAVEIVTRNGTRTGTVPMLLPEVVQADQLQPYY